MSAATIPGWMLAEIADWMENARTGELAFEFNSGRPQRFRRHETCSPPKEPVPAGLPKWPTQTCPDCQNPMAEDHVHERFRCVDVACNRVTTIWELRRQGKFIAHE